MALKFPDTENFGYSFSSGEIELASSIYTAIENISTNQPLEEGVIYGSAAEPLQTTRGQLQIGEGNVEFSSIEEAVRFVEELGDGWQEKRWPLVYTLTKTGAPNIKIACFGCRLLDCEFDHGQGPDALGAALPFSFMYRTINGKKSLINQRV